MDKAEQYVDGFSRDLQSWKILVLPQAELRLASLNPEAFTIYIWTPMTMNAGAL